MSVKPGSVEQDLINLINENMVLRSERDGARHEVTGLESVVQRLGIHSNKLAMQNDFLRWMFVMLVLANRNNTNEQ